MQIKLTVTIRFVIALFLTLGLQSSKLYNQHYENTQLCMLNALDRSQPQMRQLQCKQNVDRKTVTIIPSLGKLKHLERDEG
jgi:hypothetical protein